MAFPAVQSVTETIFDADDDNHLVGMPATVSAGDLLIILICLDGVATFTTPTDWASLGSALGNGTDCRLGIFAKKAAGTEDGGTVDVVSSAPEKGAAQCYRITGWRDSGTLVNDVEVGAFAAGSSDQPNPPSLNPSNWDVEDTLWLAVAGWGEESTASGYPSSYTNGVDTGSTAGGSATNCAVGSARRENATAAEDPGVFTLSASGVWVAQTIAIRPAGVGATAEVDAVLEEVVASLNVQQRYLSTISATVDETQASLRAYLQPGPNIDATLDETLASLNAQQRYLSTITATVDEIAAALNARSFHGTTVGSTLDKVTASFGLNQRYLATIDATVDETQASLSAAQTDLVRIDADLDEVLASLELLADVSTEIDAVLDKVIAALAAVVPTNITIVSILDEVVAALGVAEVDEGAAIIRWIATRARLQRSEPGRSLTPAGVGIARREPGRGIAPRVSRRIER